VESAVSWLYLQAPDTTPYPELYQSITHCPIPFTEDKLSSYLRLRLQSSSLHSGFRPKFCMIFWFLPCTLFLRSPHPLWFTNHNDVWREIKSMQLVIMQFSPLLHPFASSPSLRLQFIKICTLILLNRPVAYSIYVAQCCYVIFTLPTSFIT
jgi:hypothetical protein